MHMDNNYVNKYSDFFNQSKPKDRYKYIRVYVFVVIAIAIALAVKQIPH